jgi:hypothetical protein
MTTQSVRFSLATMDRLRGYRDNLQVTFNRDPKRFSSFGFDGKLTLDDALSYLLVQQKSHGMRSRKSFDAGGRDKDNHVAEQRDEEDGSE